MDQVDGAIAAARPFTTLQLEAGHPVLSDALPHCGGRGGRPSSASASSTESTIQQTEDDLRIQPVLWQLDELITPSRDLVDPVDVVIGPCDPALQLEVS